jgi:hypothetical protein
VVVVGVAVVRVPTANVQGGVVPHGVYGQVAAVNGVAVQGVANKRRVHSEGGVVLGAVQAPAAKGVAVQVRLPAALPHVHVAAVHLAQLWRDQAIVVVKAAAGKEVGREGRE